MSARPRPLPHPRTRHLAAAAALAVAASSCGLGVSRHRDPSAVETQDPTSYGTPRKATKRPVPRVTIAPPRGRLVMRITDFRGYATAGIPVTYKGPKSGTALTSAQGKLLVELPPGHYTIRVPKGCHQQVLVDSAGGSQVGIVADRNTTGVLQVPWRHRFVPWQSPIIGEPNPWPRGKAVRVGYKVWDLCTTDFAPGAPIPTWRYKPSAGLRVVGKPVMRSDAQAQAFVTVSCVAQGNAGLTVYDADAPEDGAFDILGIRPPPNDGADWCA